LAAQTKKFGDILKHVLPRMPADAGELMTFWDTVENLWSIYEVPENLRAKLILPILTPKAKSLVSRLSIDELSDIKKLKVFLLREFRLTSREYRARFNSATRNSDESYSLFLSRLKTLWSFYMRSHGCNDFDALVDLIVADRLKDSLSGPCSKYCLAQEGQKILPAVELAALADTLDVNYTPDGRYRGATVTDFKGSCAVKNPSIPRTFVSQNQNKRVEQHDIAHNLSGSNRVRAEKNMFAHKPQVQRKCWICSSPSHMQSACTKKTASSVKADSSRVKSARVSACSVCIGDNRHRVNPTCDVSRDGDDDETTLMKVQISRCVVEVPLTTDEGDRCAYAYNCPTTLRVGESEVALNTHLQACHLTIAKCFRLKPNRRQHSWRVRPR